MAKEKMYLYLPEDDIEAFDRARGLVPRSEYFSAMLHGITAPPEISRYDLIRAFSSCETAIKAYIASDEVDDVDRLEIYQAILKMQADMRQLVEVK